MGMFKGTKGPWKAGGSFYTNHISIDAPLHGAIAHVLVKMDGDYTTHDSKRVEKEVELAANMRAIACAAEMAELLLELHYIGEMLGVNNNPALNAIVAKLKGDK